ncbi:MAG: response regulator [Planctomycetes bacterium]|nr:response regulator [Planctomycetota bacterium]
MARILIVDDEDEVVASLKMILEQEGHIVDSASSAKEGLRKTQQGEPPDLVIVDVMMETVAAGLEMAEEIRKTVLAHDLPLIVLSSINREFPGLKLGQNEMDGGRPSASRFIEKPYKPDTIREAVRMLLRAKP